MKRITALKVLNPLLGLLMLSQVATALLHDLLPKQAFSILHKQGGLVLAVVVILHVILNWNWIRTNYRGSPRRFDSAKDD